MASLTVAGQDFGLSAQGFVLFNKSFPDKDVGVTRN